MQDLTNVPPSDTDLLARRARLLGPSYRLFYETPLHPVRGAGVWLYDSEGTAYLDAYNNVPCVGHCHPYVTRAISRQAGILNTHTRYLDETILNYAEKLLAKFPSELSQAMFTCTGSEANDLALRIATASTGGTGIIVTKFAYHGVTKSVAEASPSLGVTTGLGRHVRTVSAPDQYHFQGQDISKRFAEDVDHAIEDMRANGIRPAALLVDTIFSSDGVFTEPAGFLDKAVGVIRRAGGVFIADEVQPGFGRTGKAMWGFEAHKVIPDIVTMGKPMGNGHPLAGLVAKPHLLEEFGKVTRYFNTFGGNPVSCAAGLAVLEVIENEHLMDNARRVGAYLKAGLESLASKYPIIGDIRGTGLFMGVELVRNRETRIPATSETTQIVDKMRDRHVLIGTSGPSKNVLKIRPPLIFSHDNTDRLLAVLDSVLAATIISRTQF